MTKRFYSMLLPILLLLLAIPVAAQENPTFAYRLSINGAEEKIVQPGEVITVLLYLERTDNSDSYTMYAMQSELRYDNQFLELIEDSIHIYSGVVTRDIGTTDNHRELYVNYLSMSGGTKWPNNLQLCSVQFRVIGNSGVTKITNEDYLVSFADGSGSYPCSANELTIIVSTDCLVTFMSNGGSEVANQTVIYGEICALPESPHREGYTFDGWYSDIGLTKVWDFENDVVQGNMVLYAKWIKQAEPTTAPPADTIPATNPECCFPWWLLLILLLVLPILLLRKLRKKKTEQT